jgi:hypothetical protein
MQRSNTSSSVTTFLFFNSNFYVASTDGQLRENSFEKFLLPYAKSSKADLCALIKNKLSIVIIRIGILYLKVFFLKKRAFLKSHRVHLSPLKRKGAPFV